MINVRQDINVYRFIVFYTRLLPHTDEEPYMVTSLALSCSLKRERFQNKKCLLKSAKIEILSISVLKKPLVLPKVPVFKEIPSNSFFSSVKGFQVSHVLTC